MEKGFFITTNGASLLVLGTNALPQDRNTLPKFPFIATSGEGNEQKSYLIEKDSTDEYANGTLPFQFKFVEADGENTNAPQQIATENEMTSQQPQQQPAIETSTTKGTSTRWTKIQIRNLIRLYGEYKTQFESTTVKSSTVWGIISEQFENKTTQQVIDKWKYLKSRYTQQKDAMGPRNSGGGYDVTVTFEYFYEMDVILGKDHNITPPVLAGSRRKNDDDAGPSSLSQNLENEDSAAEDDPDPLPTVNADASNNKKSNARKTPVKRNKKTAKEALLDKFSDKENSTDKRHKEKIERQDRALNLLEKIADSLTRQ